MLIKSLLNGKKIDLTGDNITIQSDNFSVDETGRIKATAGEIGGFTTTKNDFNSNLFSTYSYSQDDLSKIAEYMLGEIELTPEEFELYDVDNNNIVDAIDYMMISQYINTGISEENPGAVTLTNGDVFNTFAIKDGTGEKVININMFRSYIKTLFSNLITTNKINAGNIQTGEITITPIANEPTSVYVSFDTEFDEVPKVVATPVATVPGTTVKGVSTTNISTSGFTLWLTRTNSADTTVKWIAIS